MDQIAKNSSISAAAPTVAAEVISPAEAQFWREWAEKAPGLLRANIEQSKIIPASFPYRPIGIGVGAVLGIASFTRTVPGRWKWLSASGAAVSTIAGFVLGARQDGFNTLGGALYAASREAMLYYAQDLGSNPALQQELYQRLSTLIRAEDIQELGLEGAVLAQAHSLAQEKGYLNRQSIAARASGISR